MNSVLQYVLYTGILVAAAIPLGFYMSKIMDGEQNIVTRVFGPVERGFYKILRINPDEEMDWKKYLGAALLFNLFGFVFLFAILMCQGWLPWNPQGVDGLSWDLAFNTAISFVTNTNWQAYSGEVVLSNFSQAIGLTVQNFVSAATGIAVLWCLIRGLTKIKKFGVGNFWQDLTRCTLYILLPICLLSTIVLTQQGVPQSLSGNRYVDLVEPIAADGEGNYLADAQIDLKTGTVTVDGDVVEDAQIITKEVLPLYPQASQVSMKQLGTNGGGVLGLNSAHPFENPTVLTNMIEMIFLLVIAVGLCFSFGRSLARRGISKGMKQGIAIFMAMFVLMLVALWIGAVAEQNATPVLSQNGLVNTALGNMEGKETRFGVTTSNTWAVWTTCASNGSVNSMHDSYTPIGGLIPMLLMMLGEVVFGGVGCGLYGMIGFVILTVFIAGLMVGRTPEYLGKKIEPKEMRMAVLICLATPIAILLGSGIATLLPGTADSLNNAGAHGLSEVLYAYSSAGGNNGSAFAGFNANTVFLNVSLGLVMLFARFVPMTATVAIAGSMAAKKRVAESAGTLSTCNAMFVFLLILIVLIIGALSFFPALSLGPIAEFTQMIGLG